MIEAYQLGLHISHFFPCELDICCLALEPSDGLPQTDSSDISSFSKREKILTHPNKISRSDKSLHVTCLIIMVDEGRAARFPLAPAASSSAASPHALPTQRVNIGGLTYLEREKYQLPLCHGQILRHVS